MKAYDDVSVGERLRAQLAAHGLDGSQTLAPAQLFGLDQFHVGGPRPVERLVDRAGLDDSHTALDLGSGFGGVARLVAARSGARVLGVERATAYVSVARELTARCGLADRVRFLGGDVTALPLPPRTFEAAFLCHVQVNVSDKRALFAEIGRVLRPGGRLLLWELCCDEPDALTWPMPWSLDGRHSHVVAESVLRERLVTAGAEIVRWADRTAWAADWVARLRSAGPPKGPRLPALLEDGHRRVRNIGQAIAAGQVALVEGIARF